MKLSFRGKLDSDTIIYGALLHACSRSLMSPVQYNAVVVRNIFSCNSQTSRDSKKYYCICIYTQHGCNSKSKSHIDLSHVSR